MYSTLQNRFKKCRDSNRPTNSKPANSWKSVGPKLHDIIRFMLLDIHYWMYMTKVWTFPGPISYLLGVPGIQESKIHCCIHLACTRNALMTDLTIQSNLIIWINKTRINKTRITFYGTIKQYNITILISILDLTNMNEWVNVSEWDMNSNSRSLSNTKINFTGTCLKWWPGPKEITCLSTWGPP